MSTNDEEYLFFGQLHRFEKPVSGNSLILQLTIPQWFFVWFFGPSEIQWTGFPKYPA